MSEPRVVRRPVERPWPCRACGKRLRTYKGLVLHERNCAKNQRRPQP